MGREKAASAYKEETGMSHGVIIKDAVKRYGDFTALKGVNLEIKQGEFFTLLGPSGCGKTTLLRMIAGFNSVDGGEICFDDKVINNLEAHKRDIGMVFQNYAIFPHLTVAENVAYGLKAKKYPKDQIPGKVEDVVNIGDEVTVKVTEVDKMGRINLTMRPSDLAENKTAARTEEK